MQNVFEVLIFDAAGDRDAEHSGQLGLKQFRPCL